MKLTEVGKKQLELVIKENEKKLRELREEKIQCGITIGHDNSDLEQIVAKERMLMKLISDHKKTLAISQTETITNTNYDNEDIVAIGKDIKVILTFEDGKQAESVVRITENFSPTISKNKKHITLNAPLAECILHKQEGFTGKYYVNNSLITAKVLAIL